MASRLPRYFGLRAREGTLVQTPRKREGKEHRMFQEGPIHAIGKAFVEHVNSGSKDDSPLWEKYMDPGLVSIEADGKTWTGLDELKKKHEEWFNTVTYHGGSCEGPFVSGDRFMIRFEMDIESKDGTWPRMNFSEVGIYDVKNGKVVREEFFAGPMPAAG